MEICRRIKPDFVLTDIGLPGMDGYDLAVRLRKECGLEGVPIWAVSAPSGQPGAADRRRNHWSYRQADFVCATFSK